MILQVDKIKNTSLDLSGNREAFFSEFSKHAFLLSENKRVQVTAAIHEGYFNRVFIVSS